MLLHDFISVTNLAINTERLVSSFLWVCSNREARVVRGWILVCCSCITHWRWLMFEDGFPTWKFDLKSIQPKDKEQIYYYFLSIILNQIIESDMASSVQGLYGLKVQTEFCGGFCPWSHSPVSAALLGIELHRGPGSHTAFPRPLT